MTEDDEERIDRALRKQAMGLELDSGDRWCLRARERREEKTMAHNSLGTDPGSADWDGWFNQNFDEAVRTRLIESVGEALAETAAELRADFSARLRELELQVARLEGELNVRRSARKSDVVDLPKMDWGRGNAA